jgi:cytidylate kinase
MYRAVVFIALEQGVSLDNADALEQVAAGLDIQLSDDAVVVNGRDVTRAIRTQAITTATRYAADHPGIRARLVELQREAAEGQNFVTEGRDQGSIVFPDAECKVFLTASEPVRAERRYHDLLARGEDVTFDEVLEKQHERDERDATRPVGALIQADDAVVLNTDGMSPDEVVDRLHDIVEQHR